MSRLASGLLLVALLEASAAAETAVRLSPEGLSATGGSAVNVNGRALFNLTNGTSAFLYSSDGTTHGTQPLPTGADLYEERFATMDGFAYFPNSSGALWRSDGTAEGTNVFAQGTFGWIGKVAAANGKVWFASQNSLWTSDGTEAGTRLATLLLSSPNNLVALGDLAIYSSADRYWRSDGTEAGTYPLAYDGEGGFSFGEYRPRISAGAVYFSGVDLLGAEPWRTEGTLETTGMIADLAPGPGASQPFGYTSVAGRLFFTTEDLAPGLWTTDGTPAGTQRVVALPGAADRLRGAGRLAYFIAPHSGAYPLWRSDGTADGTFVLVPDLGPVATSFVADMAADVGGRLVFAACEPATGCEPWITDGSLAGTRLLADLAPGSASSGPRGFAFVGGHVVFSAADAEWAIALPTARTPDFDLNGYADICWQGADERLSLWLMRGVEALETPAVQPPTPPAGARLAACGDLTGDGTADLLFRDVEGGALEVWRMQGSRRLDAQALPYRSDPSRTLVGVADLDGDDHNDLLWHTPATGALSAWLMNGLERRRVAPLTPSGLADVQWRPAGLGDFDADGKTDILFRHQGTGRLVVWLMDGLVRKTGVFLKPSQPASLGWQVQSVVDLDSDGDADVVWRHQTSGRLVAWLMDQTVRVDGRVLSPSLAP